MIKKTIFIFLFSILLATNICATIPPKENEWNVQLGATHYSDDTLNGNKANSKITPYIAYGFSDSLSLNFKYLQYKDKLPDPNETTSTQLGVTYITSNQSGIQLAGNSGVRFIDTEVNDKDGAGTLVYLGGKIYSTFNNYITGYIGLEYFTDPSSDIDYTDNLLEKVGFTIKLPKNWSINADYELSNKAFGYSFSYYFSL